MPGIDPKKEKVKIFDERPSVEEVDVGIEKPPIPEVEKKIEEVVTVEVPKEKEEEEKEEKVTLVPPVSRVPGVLPRDAMLKKIEEVLEEDLGEVYLAMSPEQQKVFKEKGEETASKIRILAQQVKIHVKEILNIIKKWLSFIPGVNKFFLEQEAKIKTDKILQMTEEKEEK